MSSKILVRREGRVWTRDLLIAIGIAVFIIVFLYKPILVEGTSMAPLLCDQERIFINQFVYHFEPIERGDVVVFWYPLDRTKSFIKRIIALPDETVEIRHGTVYVNGDPLSEPYVPSQYKDLTDFGPIRVPSDSYFVMGDHRISSNDSRVFGPVASRFISGRATFAYWPRDHFGSLAASGTAEAKTKWTLKREIGGSDGALTLGTVMDTKQIENLSKALGDEMRLRVLAAINAPDNLTCGDLARLPGVTLATISYHLKILRAMASTIMFASSFLLKRNEPGKRENVSVH